MLNNYLNALTNGVVIYEAQFISITDSQIYNEILIIGAGNMNLYKLKYLVHISSARLSSTEI